MSTTVLEALYNAQANLRIFEKQLNQSLPYKIAMEQLNNAIEALENEMNANDVIQDDIFGEIKTNK